MSYRPDYSGGRPRHMRPARSASPARSPKRRRGEDSMNGSIYHDYRDRSPDSHTIFLRASRSPERTTNPDISRMPRRDRRRSPPPSQRTIDSYRPPSHQPLHPAMEPQPHNRASKSSRIRSLRRLLAGASNLPPPARQEKERELASLLLDQEKAKGAKEKRKKTGKYHFVRFMEKQKAERKLKTLQKELQIHRSDSPEKEGGPEEQRLEKEISIVKVDIAYATYTPLNSKYVSLYADADPKLQAKADRIGITTDDLQKIYKQRDENMDVLRNASGEKPPGWCTVERLMGNQAALERLRDEGTDSWIAMDQVTLGIVGGKKEGTAWMDDDGIINPEDLDSPSDSEGGVDLKMANGDDSDGDFFE